MAAQAGEASEAPEQSRSAARRPIPARSFSGEGHGPRVRLSDGVGEASDLLVMGLELSDDEVRRFREQARSLLQERGYGLRKLSINGEDQGLDRPDDRRDPWR